MQSHQHACTTSELRHQRQLPLGPPPGGRHGEVRLQHEHISDANLPLKILQHKYIELNAENYEEWFDMVRYNLLDGIDFTELRYIRSYKHKCLPIPYDALAGNNLLIQNPDYVYE